MSIIIKETPLQAVWQMRKEVMYPDLSIEEMKLPDDEEGDHLGLYNHEQLCVVISLFMRGKELQFRKFATVTHLQGKGYGTALLKYVFEKVRSQNINSVWCNARTTASPFYQKFGMKPFGNTWEQLGHQFVKMKYSLLPEERT